MKKTRLNHKWKLTDEDRVRIESALHDCGGGVRAAARALDGIYSFGAVQKIAKSLSESVSSAARISQLEARCNMLAAERGEAIRQLGAAVEFGDRLAECVAALPAPKPRVLLAPKTKGEAKVDLVLLLSDLHISEVISPSEMEGLNAYNYAIARQRLLYFQSKLADYVALQRKGYNLQDLHVLCLGDLVSGDIHQELIQTNEFTTPEACVRTADLLAEFLSPLSSLFPAVHLHELGSDNHGRLWIKPQCKKRALNSWNYPLYALLNARLSSHRNIATHQHLGIKAQIDINSKSVLIEHGNDTKMHMGIPYYGLERTDSREAKRRMKLRRPYDLHCWGHFHTPAWGPWGIMNGALCGTTEFDHGCGRHADPSQVTFLMHRSHGPYNMVAWALKEADSHA